MMGKEVKRLMVGAPSIICLLTAVSLCIVLSVLKDATVSCENELPNWQGNFTVIKVDEGTEEREPLLKLLRSLVKGEERNQLEITGFTCHFDRHTEMCLSTKPVRISGSGLTIHVLSNESHLTGSVRPYPRRDAEFAMKLVTPVQILHGKTDDSPTCNIIHDVPSVIFSSGFIGNTFHEFSEIIIPLFLTSRLFRSRVKFVVTDYNPRWINKYTRILNHLSGYEALDLANGSVHCFPGSVVGLQYHSDLAINSSDVPEGHSMREFRNFLREAYGLETKSLQEIENGQTPVLMLVARRTTRKILNEDAVTELARKLGFKVVRTLAHEMSDLDQFTKTVSSCSVMVGVHGAGLTNEIFLPDGAVVVQVVPLGQDWASATYYGVPSTAMDIQYLEYKIQPEESSLSDIYSPDHPVIADPGSIYRKGGYKAVRAVYVDGQDVKINLARFNETLVEAMRLVGSSITSGLNYSPLQKRRAR